MRWTIIANRILLPPHNMPYTMMTLRMGVITAFGIARACTTAFLYQSLSQPTAGPLSPLPLFPDKSINPCGRTLTGETPNANAIYTITPTQYKIGTQGNTHKHRQRHKYIKLKQLAVMWHSNRWRLACKKRRWSLFRVRRPAPYGRERDDRRSAVVLLANGCFVRVCT